MKTFVIEEQLANNILNYLARRPWVEVNELVSGLMNLSPASDSQQPEIPTQNPTDEQDKKRVKVG